MPFGDDNASLADQTNSVDAIGFGEEFDLVLHNLTKPGSTNSRWHTLHGLKAG